MKTVPKLDPVADSQRQVESKQLAVSQNTAPGIPNAGIVNTELPLQGQRYHVLRRSGRAAIPNI